MRIAMFAAVAACILLTACGGPQSSEANNAQANIANDAAPPATTNATNAMTMLASAPPTKDEALKIMHERHEGMETIGKSNKAIKRELDAASPDLAVVRASSVKIAQLSREASGWFAKGTGPELGKTGAKPEIWQNPQDFAAKLGSFQKAAQIFDAAARGSDANATKARFADMAGTCKACHEKYRSEMHH